MEKEYSLLENYEWLGEFWICDKPLVRFPGVLKYSPSKGVILSLLTNKDENLFDTTNKSIFGSVEGLGNVSVFASFSHGAQWSNSRIHSERIYCRYLIVGKHADNIEPFDTFSFSLNNLDEFCYPQGFEIEDEYFSAAVLSSTITSGTKLGKLSLSKSAKGHFGFQNISKLLLVRENKSEFKKELDEAVTDLMKKHKIDALTRKTEINYEFYIKGEKNEKQTLSVYRKMMHNIAILFSVLSLKTIRPVKIVLLNNLEGHYYRARYPVLISQHLDEFQIEDIKKEKEHHFSLPVNINGIKDDFDSIVKKWSSFYDQEFNIILTSVLNHISHKYDSSEHFILLVSSLERWASLENPCFKVNSKYDWVLERYAGTKLKEYLQKFLPVKSGVSIGQHLKNFRACIVHPASIEKGYKNYKKFLRSDTIDNISEGLFMVLVIAIYSKIGISEKAISMLQDGFQRHIRNHWIDPIV